MKKRVRKGLKGQTVLRKNAHQPISASLAEKPIRLAPLEFEETIKIVAPRKEVAKKATTDV
jgi:hypothetical protein